MKREFDKAPIIIGGCPRSGTSLLVSILSADPSIYCIPEEAWAFYDTKTLSEFERLVDQFLWKHLPENTEASYERWCEKTPRNVLAFGNIIEFFGPQARLIHIVRDGRDVITSRHPHDPGKYWVNGLEWIWYVTEGLRFFSHPQVFTIRYEDLVLKFQDSVEAIYDFLGEQPPRKGADWYQHAQIRAHSAWFQEVQPIHARSIGRWKLLEDSAVFREFMGHDRATELLSRLKYL